MNYYVDGALRGRRLLMVTGKGGVGKTTVSAAMAEAVSQQPGNTLVAEVTSDLGTPSQLLNYFGIETARTEQPTLIREGLYGTRITPSTGHRLFLRAALRFGMLADAAMRSSALNRFLMAAPAFPEVGMLYQLAWLLRDKRFDRLVLDLPATGHSLSLVRLPRIVLSVIPKGLIRDAIAEALDVMTDKKQTASVLVAIPEILPVTEVSELSESMSALGVDVGLVLLNQVPGDIFTTGERQVLDEFIQNNAEQHVLGTRELRRLDRAQAAKELFRNSFQEGTSRLEIPIYDGTWPQIVQKISDLFLRSAVFGESL